MIAQTALVALAAALASAYLVRGAWRTWSRVGAGGCPGGCGCAATTKPAAPGLIGTDDLLARVRERKAAGGPSRGAED